MELEVKTQMMKMPMIWALSSCAKMNGRDGMEVVKAFGEVMIGYSLFHLGSKGTYKLLDALRDGVEDRWDALKSEYPDLWEEHIKNLKFPE